MLVVPLDLTLSGILCYVRQSGDKQRVAQSSLKPSFVEDNNGWYISVFCGSLTDQLYVNKLDVSKKALGKCILAKGGWHSPPEFETLNWWEEN